MPTFVLTLSYEKIKLILGALKRFFLQRRKFSNKQYITIRIISIGLNISVIRMITYLLINVIILFTLSSFITRILCNMHDKLFEY